VLAAYFDAMRRYRKAHGRHLLKLITKYMTDERLVRIKGDMGAVRYVPLVRQPDTAKYDIVVDESPDGPNQKDRVWMFMMQMGPMLAQLQLPPPVWLKLMEFSPVPQSLVAEIQKIMQQQPQQPNPLAQKMQMEMQIKQAEMQMRQQEAAARFQLEMQRNAAKIQTERQMGELRAQLERERAAGVQSLRALELEAEIERAQREFEAKIMQMQREFEAKIAQQNQQMEAELQLQLRQQDFEAALQAQPRAGRFGGSDVRFGGAVG
jgi:hypothetical protein